MRLSSLAPLLSLLLFPSLALAAAPGGKAKTPPPAPVAAPVPPPPPPVFDEPWRAAQPNPAAEPQFQPPLPERFTLKNGLEVLLVTRRGLPLISASLTLPTGSMADPPGKEGTAWLTAAMLDEGTRSYTSLTLSNALQTLATDVSVGAGLEMSYLTINCLADRLGESLAVVTEMLTAPTFPEADLDRVRKLILAQIVADRARPQSVANETFRRILFGNVFAGRPANGREDTLPLLTRKDLVAFHKKAWTPTGATLAVAGDVDRATLEELLSTHLGKWKKGKLKEVPLALPPPQAGRTVYLIPKAKATQSYLLAGNLGIARLDPQYFPAQVMNMTLGGMFTSRLNLNLREQKGFTYGIRTDLATWKRGGMFVVSASVHAEHTAESIAEIWKELDAITSSRPVTPGERDFAALSLMRSYPQSFETLDSVAGELGNLGFYGLPSSYLTEYPQRVGAVDAQGATATASLVRPADHAVVVVGDPVQVEAPLRALGVPVVILDEKGWPLPTAK